MKKVIVFGSFDPLHMGHLSFFKQARVLGDSLTVVVARDERIKALKGRKPKAGEALRVEAVRQAKIADKVILGDRAGEYQVINREEFDIIAVGYDQMVPEELKNNLKKYKIVKLRPFEPTVFKSSKLSK